ncbi:hypothetical protein [Acetobacter sp. LMG 32666]|uniref:hypothetical protein n=1 Tax=Acetobacter sp. LMG 32666 TaxID=2959295 RepID=UPI0030C83857
MTDTVFCLTEATIFASCLIWSCSLAFVRSRFGLRTTSATQKQVIVLRLVALVIFGLAVKISLSASIVPDIAICIMLLSINSIIIALLLCFTEKKR